MHFPLVFNFISCGVSLRVRVIIFGSVWFLLKNQNWFKPTGFGLFLGQKTVQTGSALFFGLTRFGLVFFQFGFSLVFLVSEPNRSVFLKF